MNYFEQELRKLFDKGQSFENPSFVGRDCLGTLGKDLRVRVQFATSGYADHYDALQISVLNRTDGLVDTLSINLKELLGKKAVPGNPNFSGGVEPYIWVYRDEVKWYAFHPSAMDYQAMRQAVGGYLDIFRERQMERAQDVPKLVYICAPLRGDLEKNIEFARQKAQEVFQQGDIPVCPHMMFPPLSSQSPPGSVSANGENCASFLAPPLPTEPASLGFGWVPATNPAQDQAAREMGLRLVESCQQVNVYGPEWTEGMWAEINHASKLDIPIMTDQKTIGKNPTQLHSANLRTEKKGYER